MMSCICGFLCFLSSVYNNYSAFYTVLARFYSIRSCCESYNKLATRYGIEQWPKREEFDSRMKTGDSIWSRLEEFFVANDLTEKASL